MDLFFDRLKISLYYLRFFTYSVNPMKARITPAAKAVPVEAKLSHHSFFREAKIDIKERLINAVRHTLYACVIGASNKFTDIEKTAGWVYNLQLHSERIGNYKKKSEYKPDPECAIANYAYCEKTERLVTRNHAWLYQWDEVKSRLLICARTIGGPPETRPADEPQTKTCIEHLYMLAFAMFSLETRFGNCHNRCCVVAKYLWEHNAGIKRIEIAGTVNFDHYIVIVNRKDGSVLNDTRTWGDAWVVDPWYGKKGLIFSAFEYEEKIKKIKSYVKWEAKQYAKLGMEPKPVKESESEPLEITASCFKEIRPQVDKYPTSSLDPFFPLEHYYFINLNAPRFVLEEFAVQDRIGMFRSKARIAHQELFRECMSELQEVHSNHPRS